MFSYEVLKDDGIIVMTVTGQLTVEDYQNAMPKFLAEVRSQAIRKLLLDLRRNEGFASERAKYLSFDAWKEGRLLFDKFAVVSHDGIRSETSELLEYFRNVEKDIRQFSPAQYEAASDWLKGKAPTSAQSRR